MRKLTAIGLVTALVLGLMGCGGSEEQAKVGDDPNSAAVMNKNGAQANPEKAAGAASQYRGTQKMPEGAGRPPVTGDILPPK